MITWENINNSMCLILNSFHLKTKKLELKHSKNKQISIQFKRSSRKTTLIGC